MGRRTYLYREIESLKARHDPNGSLRGIGKYKKQNRRLIVHNLLDLINDQNDNKAACACSDTTLFSSSFFFIFSRVFAALAAKGILVLSVICINSTDKMGGKSIGALIINGKLNAVIA